MGVARAWPSGLVQGGKKIFFLIDYVIFYLFIYHLFYVLDLIKLIKSDSDNLGSK